MRVLSALAKSDEWRDGTVLFWTGVFIVGSIIAVVLFSSRRHD